MNTKTKEDISQCNNDNICKMLINNNVHYFEIERAINQNFIVKEDIDFTVHKERESFLTTLSKTDLNYHYASLRIFHYILLGNILTLLDFCVYPERALLFLQFLVRRFDGMFNIGIVIFIGFYATYFLVWAMLRCIESKLVNTVLGIPLVLAYVSIPFYVRLNSHLGIMTCAFVVVEQIRVLIKIWAMVADNCYLKINERANFREAFYYFFVPTFVFQKEYPRNSSTNIATVSMYSFRLIVVAFHIALIAFKIGYHQFHLIASQINRGQIDFVAIFFTLIAVGYIGLCFWYSVFHLWCNIWAEIVSFADRLFYRDWWVSYSFRYLLKTWNIPVHCFLKKYVFRKLYGKSKKPCLAIGATLMLSMVFHDYAAFMIIGICPPYWITWPVLMLIVYPFRANFGSIFKGLIVSLVTIAILFYFVLVGVEYQFRQNCDSLDIPKFLDPFVLYIIFGKNCSLDNLSGNNH